MLWQLIGSQASGHFFNTQLKTFWRQMHDQDRGGGGGSSSSGPHHAVGKARRGRKRTAAIYPATAVGSRGPLELGQIKQCGDEARGARVDQLLFNEPNSSTNCR